MKGKKMRQDLDTEIIEQAKRDGWEVIERKTEGDSRSFKNGNVEVWRCIHNDYPSWAKAELINGRYTGHTYNTDLRVQLWIHDSRN